LSEPGAELPQQVCGVGRAGARKEDSGRARAADTGDERRVAAGGSAPGRDAPGREADPPCGGGEAAPEAEPGRASIVGGVDAPQPELVPELGVGGPLDVIGRDDPYEVSPAGRVEQVQQPRVEAP